MSPCKMLCHMNMQITDTIWSNYLDLESRIEKISL